MECPSRGARSFGQHRTAGCSFEMIKSPRHPWSGPRHVIHHGLQDLKILLPVPHFGDCLDCLTLPSLQHLTIELYAAPLRAQNILSLLERSSCSLRTLDVGRVFEGRALVSMLRQIPSLCYLSLKPCSTNDTFSAVGLFELLARTSQLRSHKDVFLPELECLKYYQSRTKECERVYDLIPGPFGYTDREEGGFNPQRSIRPLRNVS